MFEPAHGTRFADGHRLVVEEGDTGRTKRDHREHGGRFKGGDDADEISCQNKQEQRAEEGKVPLRMMVDHVLGLALDKAVKEFEDSLDARGSFDGESATGQPEYHHQKQDHKHLHGIGVRPRRSRVGWRDPGEAQ